MIIPIDPRARQTDVRPSYRAVCPSLGSLAYILTLICVDNCLLMTRRHGNNFQTVEERQYSSSISLLLQSQPWINDLRWPMRLMTKLMMILTIENLGNRAQDTLNFCWVQKSPLQVLVNRPISHWTVSCLSPFVVKTSMAHASGVWHRQAGSGIQLGFGTAGFGQSDRLPLLPLCNTDGRHADSKCSVVVEASKRHEVNEATMQQQQQGPTHCLCYILYPTFRS